MQKYLYLLELFDKYFHWLKPEAIEQAKLVLYLEKNKYKYTSIPNSTWTSSNKQKILNTMTWVSPWLCDMFIVLKRWSLLFIEMKLPKRILKSGKLWASKSVVSDDQKRWIDILSNIDNTMACIGYGHKDAIDQIEHFENL